MRTSRASDRKVRLSRILLVVLLLCAQPAFAAISFVQSTSLFGTTAGTTTTSNAFPASPAIGDTVVVLVWNWTQNKSASITVTDSAGNTYAAATQSSIVQSNWYEGAAVFWAPVANTAGAFAVTVASPGNDGSTQIRAVALEYSGVGPVDATGAATGVSGSATVATTQASTSANELVVSVLGIDNPATKFSSITPSGAFTTRAWEPQNAGDTAGAGADQLGAAPAIQSNTWTTSPGLSGWAAVIASFSPENSICGNALYGAASLNVPSPSTVNGHSISGSGNAVDPLTGLEKSIAGTTFAPLSPAAFPGGGAAITVPGNGTLSPGTYSTVTASGNLVLQPGTYYINSLSSNGTITISPAGVVQLYIGSTLNLNTNGSVNGGGAATNLQIYLYNNASITQQSGNSTVSAFIYSPFSTSRVTAQDHLTFNGEMIIAGQLSFGDTNTFTDSPSTQASIAALGACGSGGGAGGGSGAPAAMNAVDVGASATSGKIGTKTAGVSFTLDLYALNSSKSAVDTANASAILVDLLANTATGVSLDANNCPTSFTSLAVGTFTFASGKVAAAAIGAVSNAWRDVRVRMRYPSTGAASVTACSSDNFAIKPATLAVQASDATASTAGTARILNVASAPGTPVHRAGQPFTLSVTAYNGAATPAVASNYAGTPAVATATAISPATSSGSLVAGSFSASAGTATSSTATYSEAGSASVVLQDTTFASVDAGDGTAASCAGYYVCSAATTIGRFVPDHFAISASAPGAACNGFTYFGQDFSTPFVITAQNAANATTQNYSGTLARLALTSWSGFVFTASGNPSGSTLSSGATAPTGSWALGVASVGAGQNLSAPATPSPPASVSILAQPVDSDGVTTAAATPITSSAATLYQGRARMQNAIGPETLDLPVPFRVEYWQSAIAGWQLNSADTCTPATVAIASGTLAASSTCVRDSGSPGASGAGCAGTPTIANHRFLEGGVSGTDAGGVAGFAGNFNLWLKGPGAGNLGFVTLTASVPAWLQYNWSGVAGNPSAIATFGMNRGGPVIYRTEHY
jgi:hypothetical protein